MSTTDHGPATSPGPDSPDRPDTPVHVVELTASECWPLLEATTVARIGWPGPDGVSILPVNFIVAERALWFRTNPYSTLAREADGHWVAVETDALDHEELSGWSVMARGVATLVRSIDVPGPVHDLRVWPSGIRNVFVRVEPVHLTGRVLRRHAPDHSAEQPT